MLTSWVYPTPDKPLYEFAPPFPSYHPCLGGGFAIRKGCASVLNTKSSRLMTSGSEKMRKKYLSVSAIQKLCSVR